MSWRPYGLREGSTVTGTLLEWPGLGDAQHAPRTVLAWLPPSYHEEPDRHYPVIYFHDGQNVFDAATSNSGEWEADETLTRLAGEGLEAIAVGVPHGGERRFFEYSPAAVQAPDLPEGGGADAYVAYLVDTVKALVDSSFRTRPEPQYTVTVGSSMGAVVSLHALLTRPDVFGHAGLLSPAFWTGGDFSLEQARHSPTPSGRVWVDVGGRESEQPGRAEAYLRDAQTLAEVLRAGGMGDRAAFLTDPQAIHHESAWAARLPAALRFLLGGPVQEAASPGTAAPLAP
ncbi:alpha/beta hydrolase [Deinococcus sp. Leaf326]|uniref:alpha/beta hydrolase n=1 Tax=Deinococcus sp. Leaf326 TaxID=1736338 RepID=UPI0006F86B7B|nr:alpha/beta hydrolase-fold protein [Deinococcus sp. Leaf326]KQR27823.1 hypothetical protein ASF71_04245 [Deinococcus sp. Leaf326]